MLRDGNVIKTRDWKSRVRNTKSSGLNPPRMDGEAGNGIAQKRTLNIEKSENDKRVCQNDTPS